jgi:hypothetical protein
MKVPKAVLILDHSVSIHQPLNLRISHNVKLARMMILYFINESVYVCIEAASLQYVLNNNEG